MPRPRHLIVAAACAAALVAGWFAGRDVAPPPTTTAIGTSAAAPPAGVPRREPRAHAAESADATDADEKPPAPAKPPGRLIVHVVAAEDDSPIPGAVVRDKYEEDKPLSATTDANGDAHIDVPMSETNPDAADDWYEAAAPGRVRNAFRVTVASGAEQRATVTLRSGFAIDARVHDAAGRPVAAARVVVLEADTCCPPYPEVASATGDADGRVRVDGVPLHSHTDLEISAPGHARRKLSRRPHDTRPLDVTLDAAGTIRGVVRTPDDAPVESARVVASAVAEEGERGVEDVDVETGEDGAFVLDTLDLGRRWTLVARGAGFMESERSAEIPMSAQHAAATCDLALRPAAHVEIELGFAVPHAPSVARLVFPLEPDRECPVPGRTTVAVTSAGTWHVEASVDGLCRNGATEELGPGETKTVTIRFDEGASIAGVAVDDLGATVGGAVVKAVDVDQTARESASGPDGRFVVKGLRPVEHELHVTSADHGDGIALKVTAPRDDLRITLARNGEVVAKLRLPAGATPPEKYAVHWNAYPICPNDKPDWADGVLVRSLPPATYIVDIDVEGYVKWERRDVDVVAGGHTDLGEIVLDPGLPLSGRVVDLDGHAVPQIDVFVDSDDLLRTDATGSFRWPHLAAGSHEVSVSLSPDFLDATVPVTLGKDTAPLVIALHRGALLRVRVTGAAAKDDETINVRVFSAKAPDGDEAREGIWIEGSLADGFVHRLRDGSTRIEVRKDDDTVLATKHVDLHEGDDVEVEIALPK